MALPANAPVSGRIAVAVRPEKLKLSSGEPTDSRLIKSPGTGSRRRLLWRHQPRLRGDTVGDGILGQCAERAALADHFRRGDAVWVSWSPEDTLILTE